MTFEQQVATQAAGVPPAFVLDPVAMQAEDSAAVTAEFFLDSDPRPDSLGNPVIDPATGLIPTIEMVKIINRNDPKSELVQVATDQHRYRMFPRQYAAFRQGAEQAAGGTPIRVWLGDNARTKTLIEWHIHTVEQLVALSDSVCASIGPGTNDLRRRAQTWLAARKDTALADRLSAQNDALERQNKALADRLAALEAVIQAQAAREGADQPLEPHPADELPASITTRKGR